MGSKGFPSLDPFEEVDPLAGGENEIDCDLLGTLSISDRLEEGLTAIQEKTKASGKLNDEGCVFDRVKNI